MTTPAHIILNLAFLGKRGEKSRSWPILLGALLPDLPIYVGYGFLKFWSNLPEIEIWDRVYFGVAWQAWIVPSHSFPIGLAGLALCRWRGWNQGYWFFLSFILHSLGDIFLHVEDAHRHFWPLSDYRFAGPFSYWDPSHYGAWVAPLELALVVAASSFLWKRGLPRFGKWAVAALVSLQAAHLFFMAVYFG